MKKEINFGRVKFVGECDRNSDRNYANIAVFLDGKFLTGNSNVDDWKIVNEDGRLLTPIYRWINLRPETAAELEKFFNELILGGTSPEFAAAERQRKIAQFEDWVKEFQAIVDGAPYGLRHRDGTLMTTKEMRAYQARWNALQNEGAEGYVPTGVAQEEYHFAVESIAKYEKEIARLRAI